MTKFDEYSEIQKHKVQLMSLWFNQGERHNAPCTFINGVTNTEGTKTSTELRMLLFNGLDYPVKFFLEDVYTEKMALYFYNTFERLDGAPVPRPEPIEATNGQRESELLRVNTRFNHGDMVEAAYVRLEFMFGVDLESWGASYYNGGV